MTVRARRGLAVVAVAVTAALSMAGCSAHPGVAAVVGDRTITQDELARTQRELGPLLSDPSPAGVLAVLIETPAFVKSAADHGVGVNDSQATTLLAQASKKAGLAAPDPWSAGSIDVAKATLAIQALQQLDGGADIVAQVKDQAKSLDVRVNPQYGTWKDGTIAPLDQPWIATPDASASPAPAAP